MGTFASKVKPLVRAYLYFALAHVLYKLGGLARRLWIKNTLWKKIPGYPFDPLITDARANLHRLHDWRVEKMAKYPDSPLVKFVEKELVCNSPEAVEWMLKLKFDSVTKPGSGDIFFYQLKKFIGDNGIFTLRHGESSPQIKQENELWFHQRKTAALIFTKNKFKSHMQDTFTEKSEAFLQFCKKTADENEAFDIQNKFFAFTIDSIQKIFFGVDVDTVVKEDRDPFGQSFDEAHRMMMTSIFDSLGSFILCRLLLPFPFGDMFEKIDSSIIMNAKLNYSTSAKAFKGSVDTLDEIAASLISQARKDKNLKSRRDMLALFLCSKMHFSDRDLRDIILNLTIAGRDTTACTLTWTIYILTQHPEIERKLCEEVDSVLNGKCPSLEDLEAQNMPYLNGILFESLRLYPPVPIDTKRVSKDTEYLDGTKVPKGTQLTFIPYTMGRDPRMYPDPNKVDPMRWIPFNQPSPYAFPVFQAGPRFCLGKDMAQFEAKFLIARLYQQFTFKLVPGEAEKITYSNNITMSLCNSKSQDSHELNVIPVKRN